MTSLHKKYQYLLFIFSFLLFTSLSCSNCDDIKCVAFDPNYKAWLGFNQKEKVVYTNNSHDIELQMNYKGFSGYYEIDATSSLFGDCNFTEEDCRQTSEMVGEFDTSIDGYNDFRVVIKNNFFRDELNLFIYLYDFQDHFKIKPKVLFHNSFQKLHDTINLNGIDYHNVISTRLDTTKNVDQIYRGGPQQRVWKVYYSKNEGLIAFEVRKPFKTIYYLKP